VNFENCDLLAVEPDENAPKPAFFCSEQILPLRFCYCWDKSFKS